MDVSLTTLAKSARKDKIYLSMCAYVLIQTFFLTYLHEFCIRISDCVRALGLKKYGEYINSSSSNKHEEIRKERQTSFGVRTIEGKYGRPRKCTWHISLSSCYASTYTRWGHSHCDILYGNAQTGRLSVVREDGLINSYCNLYCFR